MTLARYDVIYCLVPVRLIGTYIKNRIRFSQPHFTRRHHDSRSPQLYKYTLYLQAPVWCAFYDFCELAATAVCTWAGWTLLARTHSLTHSHADTRTPNANYPTRARRPAGPENPRLLSVRGRVKPPTKRRARPQIPAARTHARTCDKNHLLITICHCVFFCIIL